jgi:hypothetical protein
MPKKNYLKAAMGKWGLHETSNNNGIREIYFATNDTIIIDHVLVVVRYASIIMMLEVVDVQNVTRIAIYI